MSDKTEELMGLLASLRDHEDQEVRSLVRLTEVLVHEHAQALRQQIQQRRAYHMIGLALGQ